MKRLLFHFRSAKIVSFLLRSSLLGLIALTGLEILRYPGFTVNNLGVSAISLAVGLAIVHLIVRWKWSASLGESTAQNLLLILFPASLILAFFMYYSEEQGGFYPNLYFSEFSIHYLGIATLGVISLI